ncbi:hypothetical protein GCM10022216_10600 [Sphingobacterium kyonggiense]|uniref:Uncharacterized protein n=1 Tax=Sphingobacterium kyonggiense TaxID=714075 RepID=A0ABP7YHG2_9SPHI
MSYTNQDILGRIGDLLVDLNERYAALNSEDLSKDRLELLMLSAKAKYLAEHLTILANEQADPNQSAKSVVSEESIFTPPVEVSAQEADNQPVEEEIQEVEPVDEEVSSVEEYHEEIPFSSQFGAESNKQDEEVRKEEQEEVEDTKETDNEEIEEATTSITDSLSEPEPDVEEYKEEAENDQEVAAEEASEIEQYEEEKETEQTENTEEKKAPVSEEPASYQSQSSPVHTPESNYTSVKPAYEQEAKEEVKPVEKAEPIATEPVVNEVRIEEKEVRIEEPAKPEATLNDLAKEAEAKPNRPLTLNELIQQQKRAGMTHAQQFNTSSSRSSETIVDLKTAVSLNDKLLFIKDLFNGYSLAYSEAIELLNRFDNFAEADAFLQSNYALKNNWATKPQTVDKLYELLRKKFN